MGIIKIQSPNFNDRKNNGPDMLVLHYTDTKTIEESLYLLQSTEHEVSAHYLIGEDGTMYHLVNENKRAWHAGVSYWGGETDINSRSIGIEIQNPGHTNGYKHFPTQQMRAVIDLCKNILRRHQIPQHHILGHSDIAPDRKQDPGELFDWQLLAKNGIGLWPEPTTEYMGNTKTLKDAFIEFGYNPDIPEDILLRAFQQHFIQDKQQNIQRVLSDLNCSKAQSLHR